MAATPWNSLKFLKGDPIALESGKGKTVFVLEFWATWCPPCRTSIPHLTELQHKYASKGVVFIGVTDEQERAVQRFVQQMGAQMDYRVATDTTGEVQSAYMGRYGESVMKFFQNLFSSSSRREFLTLCQGIPCAFVIDRSGRITYHGHPMEPQFEAALSTAANSPVVSDAPKLDIRGKSRDELMAMPVRELKQVLTDHNVNISGLLEKTDLVDQVMQVKSNM